MKDKVFISWSGELSRKVAELLSEWIGDVNQKIKPWTSTADIEKGSIWFNELSNQLADVNLGISCITRENMNAPWLLFEAGALSKGVTSNRVVTFLIDISHAELSAPLSAFNGTLPKKEDLYKLFQTMNKGLDGEALSEDRLKRSFETHWEKSNNKFQDIINKHKTSKTIVKKPQNEILEEILETVRVIQKNQEQTTTTEVDDNDIPF